MCWKIFLELGQLWNSPCLLPSSGIHSLLPDVWCKKFLFHLSCLLWSWDRRINVSFTPLCRLQWRSPCNQNSLNALWMLGTDFCACMQTWLGICAGALERPSLAGETCQLQIAFAMGYVQFSSVSQKWPTLCNPMACSMSGLAFLHQLLEILQSHVHRVGDAIQPSHPLSSSCPLAFNLSQ